MNDDPLPIEFWEKQFDPVMTEDEGEVFYSCSRRESAINNFDDLLRDALDLAGGDESIDFRHVWTRIDGGDGLMLINGFRICDRLDYCLTKKPWGKDGLTTDEYNEVYIVVDYEGKMYG